MEILCYNCEKPGHKQFKCWAKGGGREGQGPGQKKSAKAQKAVVAVADNDKDELFAFTCMSDYANITETLQVPKSKLGSCIDSGASEVYCPDREKFSNYRLINRSITTADGRKLKVIGMGDLEIDLPNRPKITKMIFKDAIHTLDMAFMLIAISKLDKAKYQVVFHKSTCTIINPKGKPSLQYLILKACTGYLVLNQPKTEARQLQLLEK